MLTHNNFELYPYIGKWSSFLHKESLTICTQPAVLAGYISALPYKDKVALTACLRHAVLGSYSRKTPTSVIMTEVGSVESQLSQGQFIVVTYDDESGIDSVKTLSMSGEVLNTHLRLHREPIR